MVPLSADIDLIASTLWAKIHLWDEYQTERGVTDFHRIRNGQSGSRRSVSMRSMIGAASSSKEA